MGWDDEYLVTKEMITYNNHIHYNARQFMYSFMLLVMSPLIVSLNNLVMELSVAQFGRKSCS